MRSKHTSGRSSLQKNAAHNQPDDSDITPKPILTLDLDNTGCIKSYESILKGKGGIYSLVNTINGKRYIGSAKDFFVRLNQHLKHNRLSNIALQKALAKYGYENFKICIFEYFTYESKIVSHKSLTMLETSYLSKFSLKTLYNFSVIAHNNLGYKHTEETKLKISKPGKKNPMFGKSHNENTKAMMSEKKNKYPLGVGIFDLGGNLISKFKNNVELAKHLGISKQTVGKYLNSKLVYQNTYYFKPIT
jgi:hypothetical protein